MLNLRIARMFPVGAWILGAGMVSGQIYPNKPVRFVTGAAGDGQDFNARLVAQGLSAQLGQPVIVENRGGTIRMEIVARSPSDGYTLLFTGAPLWLLPFMEEHVSYDPLKDFLPVTLVMKSPGILVVNPSLPAHSVKELIALAKARPGQLNYGSGAAGSSAQLSAELFKAMAGVDIVRISYKGTAPALADLIGGRIQLVFANATAAAPHLKAGRIRALAVTSLQPSALSPDLPTVAATGLPGYGSVSINAVFAPAKTHVAIIHRLNKEIVGVLGSKDVKERFLSTGAEAAGSSPEELFAIVKSEMARLGPLIKNIGIRAE